MTGRQVRISVNIPSPKYSQNAVRELVAEYKKNIMPNNVWQLFLPAFSGMPIYLI